MDSPDNITIAREVHLEWKGRYMYIMVNDHLDLLDVTIYGQVIKNPYTGEFLKPKELAYIKFHVECYQNTHNMELTPELLNSYYKWYILTKQQGQNPEYNNKQIYDIVKYYLDIEDLEGHFKHFDPANSTEDRYERDLATKALQAKKAGHWLLRHSSLNRPDTDDRQQKLANLGIRYYVISYKNTANNIMHHLMKHSIGKGWKIGNLWVPNFLKALELLLTELGLSFTYWVTGYYVPVNIPEVHPPQVRSYIIPIPQQELNLILPRIPGFN